MSRTTRTALVSLFALLLGLSILGEAPSFAGPEARLARLVSAGQDDYEAAAKAFRRVATSGSLEERKAALERLASIGEPDALGLLAGEIGRVSAKLREKRDEAFRARYELESKEEYLALLKLRAAKDPSLEEMLTEQQRKRGELEGRLGKLRAKVAELAPWHAALCEGSATFADSLAPAKRKKVEKEVWKDIDEALQPVSKLAAIEILGYVGGPGTAVSLQKLIVDLAKERSGLERKLPKLMGEVRKLEKRMQEENVRTGGRSSMGPQYDRAKKGAAEMQAEINLLAHMADAASEAGAVALAREEGAVLEKSVQALLRVQKKSKQGARRRTLAMLGASGIDSVLEQLLALLETEKEPAARAALTDALAEGGSEAFRQLLLEKLILDESWLVKSCAASAMAKLRLKEAIPLLLERLEVEEGRLKTDYQEALVSLTNQDFSTNLVLWRRWWKENEKDFVVPPLEEVERRASEEAKARVGTTFFGISTESTRVLFVLDLSGSMDFSMVPRNNPEDDPNRPYDFPQDGERSRLEEAKVALNKAVGGTEDEATFNIVFYASDVWTWQDNLVEMDDDSRSDAMRTVESLDAVGGTNIYGALGIALEIAGAQSGDEWSDPEIDTIFFLSDGRASVGLTTDPDEILANVRELNASTGIVIHTIGLSGAQDAYLLRSLAEQNGGKYVAR